MKRNKLIYQKKCRVCGTTATISYDFPENFDATELVSVTKEINITRDFCDPCNSFTAHKVTVIDDTEAHTLKPQQHG